MKPSELGAYLSARRARITPDEVGLPRTGHRRVPGLRREEVALLAGVSVDYYTRLEQGRERTPSGPVIDALAAALRVGEDGREHMYRLTGLSPAERTTVVDGRVAPGLLQLMSAWPDNPALVYNRAFDVIASNAIADALFVQWRHSRNLMHMVFGEPEARSFYRDWFEVARNAVAGFRLNHGKAPGDPRTQQVLTELLQLSPEFSQLWASHDARGKALEQKAFQHPEVGPLTLTMQTFDVRSNPGQELVVYHAEEGSPSSDALRLLGSLAATTRGGEQPA
ncbi:helix-turn-helix transcriptional regulator [Streptomyces griseoloalbus]|uniref:Transcriptional regulator with XRE-family HTH domain n=1 Tax=Streptomyces griseoloalbus TaxID=67303 RepID=A0A7W8FBW6_9ACTN|nr:helix-turn-helix transcriptional regulator [Streptomyces albaduncus]MBB5128749.1 transcriptional regulator with XRE-family HTH domain [Streptomyces albaduncus]GGW46316.1 transcriptional regulator [Streptomyces albaduncus]